MKLLVTGASGFIGSAFCAAAQAAGHTVTALVRPRPREMHIVGRCGFRSTALALRCAGEGVGGAEALVHCRAPRGSGRRESPAITVEGTRALLGEATRAA